MQTTEQVTHTPGPWHYEEDRSIIRVHFSLPDGRKSGVAVSIGSTALSFRAPRQGSHRGEQMVYRPFADHDRANARLIAAAPEMYELLKAIAADASAYQWHAAVNALLAKADPR